MDRRISCCVGLICLVVCSVAPLAAADSASPELLPGTKALDWPEEDLSSRLMDGAHQFVERKIAEAASRTEPVLEDRHDLARGLRSVARRKPSEIARDHRRGRSTIRTAGWNVTATTPTRHWSLRHPEYRVYQVRWPVLEGVFAEGLLVQPKQPAVAYVVALSDADQTPEQLLGLAPGIEAASQFARRLAEQGCEVVIPVLVQRSLLDTPDKQLQNTRQTWREWIYRQAFHMGRHIIGYEVQKVLAAVDWFRQQHGDAVPVGVAGHAEGGLLAFYAAALDPRIDAVLVSGYFDSRQRVWAEPIYRNVWSLLRRFGDAEIASLVLPRHLVIEHSPVVDHHGSQGRLEDARGRKRAG